jgi:hypothetical protein
MKATIVRFDTKEIPHYPYYEMFVAPLSIKLKAGDLEDYQGLITSKIDCEKIAFVDVGMNGELGRVLVDERYASAFVHIIHEEEFRLRPRVHRMLVEQLEIRDKRQTVGDLWYERLSGCSSLWQFFKLWRYAKKMQTYLDNLSEMVIFIKDNL